MNQVWIAINMFSRYMALYHQVKYNQWFDTQGILVCYAFAIIVNTPFFIPLIYYDVFGLNNVGLCGVNPINKITTMCALSGQAFPFVSNVVCVVFGCLIVKKIRGHISQVGSNLDSSLVEESRQIVILVGVSAIIPILIQSPTAIIRVLQYFTTQSSFNISFSLGSSISPICNGFHHKTVQEESDKNETADVKLRQHCLIKANRLSLDYNGSKAPEGTGPHELCSYKCDQYNCLQNNRLVGDNHL
uniref:G-protein coupled receptors family 1 profile domain-containing protein n=1 Tax=Romanomermis culicivorax TaxID=13658 RepID=A0A915JB58_ROMCU